MATVFVVLFWLFSEAALVFVGMVSPNISGPDSLYLKINLIHWSSLTAALLLGIASLWVFRRLPKEKCHNTVASLSVIGLLIAFGLFITLQNVIPAR